MHALVLSLLLAAAPDDLRVLPVQTEAGKTNAAYQRYLQAEVAAATARRTALYETLKTPDAIAARNQKLREFFVAQLGGFPERTPLNPQIVGRREFADYYVEKILFESRPQHYVTALMFLPTTKPPYPCSIVPCGHTADGKAGYQRIGALLARSGIAALVYDPIGQGERYQILDEAGKPWARSTSEHTAVGIGSILVGRNTASYRIWDGMRAIDYVTSRADVDATKIGCTGISGGGTLTEYLMALDDRIVAAAPGCAINTFARKVSGAKAGDAEQNIFGQVAFGFDHADYANLRVPRPTLFLCATRDFVDILGSWDVYREAKRTYTRFGFAERVDLVEADEEHGFTSPLRVASTRWMRRWLLGIDDAVTEPPYEPLTGDDVRCTPRGQVQLRPGARSVMDFNLEAAAAARRRELWQPENRAEALATVRVRIGARPSAEIPAPQVESRGTLDRDGRQVEKLVLTPVGGIPLPALLFRPAKKASRFVVYLHAEGKHADAAIRGPIEQLVADGAAVLAVDLRACGETGTGGSGSASYFDVITTYLLGRSLVGGRVDDLLGAVKYLIDQEIKNGAPLELIAVGSLTVPALHAAALEPKLFSKVTLRGGLKSWLDVVRDPTLPGQTANIVHGALLDYDLTDLAASLPPGVLQWETSSK
jgi:dienelactone hydrolase